MSDLPQGCTIIQIKNWVTAIKKDEEGGGIDVLAGPRDFPYPSAPAVDPRYLKALEKQKAQKCQK